MMRPPKHPTTLERSTGPIEAGAGALLIVLLGATLLAMPACSLLHAPERVVTNIVPGNRPATLDPLELLVQIQRFTDNFNLLTTKALDEYAARSGTDAARREALQLKLLSLSTVTSIASGPRPNANLLELVAVVTLTRPAVEDRWRQAADPSVWEPWLATSRVLETNVWRLAASALKPEFIDELKKTITEWSRNNPEARSAFLVRPQEFAALAVHKPEGSKAMSSVFSLVDLDPTSGLDPAVREVTEVRLLAERAMFTMQRIPFLVRWQAELMAYEIGDQPQIHQVITNSTLLAASADRLSRAAESVSQTAAQLPDRISNERKEILAALDQQEGKLKDLATEIDRVMESSAKMSTSLNTTLLTFDALMKRFGVGEPSTHAVRDTNSPPFNILDYGQVADRVAVMAKEVNALVASVDRGVPQLERLTQQAASDAQKVVDRGFRLGLILVVALVGGGLAAALAYRFVSEKWRRPIRPSTSE
jgi:hypothetical protein